MPAYDTVQFSPPALAPTVVLRAAATGNVLTNVPMLMDTGADIMMDTGADITLLPRAGLLQFKI